MTTPTIIADGSTVRILRQSESSDPDLNEGAAPIGAVLEVFTAAGPGDGDDPEGKPYYLLDSEYSIGGEFWAYLDDVEVVQTAEQIANRKAPSIAEIARFVGSNTCTAGDDIDVYETDYSDPNGIVELVGKTAEGQHFVARVQVMSVEKADY